MAPEYSGIQPAQAFRKYIHLEREALWKVLWPGETAGHRVDTRVDPAWAILAFFDETGHVFLFDNHATIAPHLRYSRNRHCHWSV